MLWGSGVGPRGEQPTQPGRDLHDTPTPPYPPGRGPTPPYQPQPDGPAQRLADARRAGRRSVRQSADPDGTPAPLPASVLGVRWRGPGGGTRVVQRFFGSGLAPLTRVQRQERRAQRATALLAALALLVISASAILIFDPSIELASFGFALNQRLHQQKSNAPLYVDGTAPPTPTSSSATPQSTSAGATPQPTATAQPTATPRPTFTPTVTPTVIPSGAVVKFKATTTSISKNTFKGCASGCDFNTANGSGSGALSSGSSFGPSGWQSTRVAGPFMVTQTIGRYCYFPLPGSDPKCVVSYRAWNPSDWGDPGFTFSASNTSFTCQPIHIPADTIGSQVDSTWCWWNTNLNPVPQNYFNGTLYYPTQPDPNNGSWYIFFFSWYSAQWNSVAHYTYVTSTDCSNAISSADPNAKKAANSAASTWIGGRVKLYQSVAPIYNSSVRYCSPGVGAQNTSTKGYVEWSWSATAFDPSTVVSTATKYVQSQVASGYLLTAGPNTCTAAQAGSSSNYSYSGGYNGTVTVTCPATGTATYDWTSDTPGTNAQDALKKAIEGKSLSQAESICQNYPGVDPNQQCTITFTGGNVQIVPSNPNEIQIQAS